MELKEEPTAELQQKLEHAEVGLISKSSCREHTAPFFVCLSAAALAELA